MSDMQIKQNPVSHKTMIFIFVVGCFMASDYVCADGQNYIYASDMIKEKGNINKRENWYYQNTYPLKVQDNRFSPSSQYSYPPPTQKPGSNPLTNPQQTYRFIKKSKTKGNEARNSHVIENTHNLNYPPPTQKPGSNPFIK